jgi:AcrR family transcriptional regulator
MSGVVATKGGRPRSPQADQAILDATTQLLIEGGFGRLSVDAVAARAGVGKATIYRRWRSKPELLRATLARIKETTEGTDTGDLRSDLRAFLRAMVDHFVDSEAAHLMPQLAAEAQFDPQLRELLYSNSRARRDVVRQILERARLRGELRDDLDFEVVIDLLTAPIFIRKLITGAPINAHATDEAVEMLLRGIVGGR